MLLPSQLFLLPFCQNGCHGWQEGLDAEGPAPCTAQGIGSISWSLRDATEVGVCSRFRFVVKTTKLFTPLFKQFIVEKQLKSSRKVSNNLNYIWLLGDRLYR